MPISITDISLFYPKEKWYVGAGKERGGGGGVHAYYYKHNREHTPNTINLTEKK